MWNRASNDTPSWERLYNKSYEKLSKEEKEKYQRSTRKEENYNQNSKQKYKNLSLFIQQNLIYSKILFSYYPPLFFSKPSFDPFFEFHKKGYLSPRLSLSNFYNYFNFYKIYFNPMWFRFYMTRKSPPRVDEWK